MPQSLAAIYIHLVYSTKNRTPWIMPDFYWQSGYGAFSIGKSGIEQVVRYLARQKEHHRKTTFQDEFRAFLKKYDVEFDERYVWD